MSSCTSEVPAITPRQTLQGHTDWVNGVVHLHAKRQVITCSGDRSLRLWDLENSTQIGEDWRDEEDKAKVRSMALSPNGKTIASGCYDKKVRLWNIETRKVIAKWLGHTDLVYALCWSGDGKRVLSGSWDGTARVWDVESGETVLMIKTGHQWVNAVIYSPHATRIATGGLDEDAVKIWDAKTGDLHNTLKHDYQVLSLAWTLDGKRLISGSHGSIRIFDTATWQVAAVLDGHQYWVYSISLSINDRFFASASDDKTARLWNLDTNLPIGLPLQHEDEVDCAALSTDGKLLVTGCENTNAYTWDIQVILKEAGLEDLLPPLSDVAAQEPFMDVRATQAMDDELSPDFFNDVTHGANSSGTYGNYHRSSSRRPRPIAPSFGSASVLFGHLLSPFRRSHSNTDRSTELQQRPRRSIFSRGPRVVEVAAVKDREVIFTAPPPPEKKQQETQPQASASQPAPSTNPTTPPKYKHSLPVRLLARLALLLFCCASPQHANENAQPTQQQQGQGKLQASPSQTQPTAPSESVLLVALDSTHPAAPVVASV
ncbi:WD40 repeat-like protein [Suillus hirtellus]|nr:WD40 repeat-like protein [Suillus hirtellus]